MTMRRFIISLSLFACLGFFTACAEVPKSPEVEAEEQAINDPYESVNRTVFDVNEFLNRVLIRPLTDVYLFIIPEYVRGRIANVLLNIGEPVVFANNVLQARFEDAWITASRFVINSTLGGAGTYEVADGFGLPKQLGDFGQTLYSWGFDSGAYIVLPLFGPSNIRDAIGFGVDTFMSPWQYIAHYGGQGDQNRYVVSQFAADGLTRSDQSIDSLDALRAGSIDFYAELRSVYRQYRDKQLGVKENNQPVFEDYE